MSFVITVYVPTGIVMASDSRQSITIEGRTPDGKLRVANPETGDAHFKPGDSVPK